MSASRESAQGATPEGGIEGSRSAYETELVEAFVFTFGPIGSYDFFEIGRWKLQFLAGMSFEDVSPTGTLSFGSIS
jgi:hypothetical protein